LVFVSDQAISSWEARYGDPIVWTHYQPMTLRDHKVISGSQKRGRHHDITLYIEHDGQIAVIAKHIYPPKLYRAPSGGLNPGESLEDGAGREAVEETGLTIELQRYLLRTNVTFDCEIGQIEWHSHIFSATTNDSTLAPTDHDEIRHARWAEPSEFATFGKIMRTLNIGGLQYRAALHEQIARLHPLFNSN
jgi:ADP-ribose pyrophosphatase YjhB (NUDIX family)